MKTISLLLITLNTILYLNIFTYCLEINSYNTEHHRKEYIKDNTIRLVALFKVKNIENILFLENTSKEIDLYLKRVDKILKKYYITSGTGIIINNNIITVEHVCNVHEDVYTSSKEKMLNAIKDVISRKISNIEIKNYILNNLELEKYFLIKNYKGETILKTKSLNITAKDEIHDLCAIKIDYIKNNQRYFKLFKEKINIGEKVYTYSFISGIDIKNVLPKYQGFFIGSNKFKNYYSLFSREGSSGSVVFNEKGYIVGIIDSVYKRENITTGSRVSQIKNILRAKR